MKILHSYAQKVWHDDAYIVGNRESLIELRDAVNRALENGTADCELFATDGEGYTMHVVMGPIQWSDEFWVNASWPYTDAEEYGLHNNDKDGPWILQKKIKEFK